jgi:hypothetical protein
LLIAGDVKGILNCSGKCGDILKFSQVFFVALVAGNPGSTPNYSVVETDYSTYAIVYNCNNIPFFKKFGKFYSLFFSSQEKSAQSCLGKRLFVLNNSNPCHENSTVNNDKVVSL